MIPDRQTIILRRIFILVILCELHRLHSEAASVVRAISIEAQPQIVNTDKSIYRWYLILAIS